MVGVEVEVPLLPAHRGRVEHRAAGPPTAAPGSTGSRSSASTQPVPPSSSETSTAPTSPSARRTAVLVAPSHQTMSVSVPGPKVRSQRRTSSAYPSCVGQRLRPLPQPAVHQGPGRARHPPVARRCGRGRSAPRHRADRARAAPATPRPPTWCRRPSSTLPSSAGSSVAERDRAQLGPVGQPVQHRLARLLQPRLAVVGETPELGVLRRSGVVPGSATRAEALPQAAGSRSRGKAKRVRRIASCLTSDRSS